MLDFLILSSCKPTKSSTPFELFGSLGRALDWEEARGFIVLADYRPPVLCCTLGDLAVSSGGGRPVKHFWPATPYRPWASPPLGLLASSYARPV